MWFWWKVKKNGNGLLSKKPTIEWNRCDEKIWNESGMLEEILELSIISIVNMFNTSFKEKKWKVLNAVKMFVKLSKTKEQQNYNVNQEKLTH